VVVAGVTKELVGPALPDDGVVAAAAIDGIIPTTAEQGVVPSATVDDVIPCPTPDLRRDGDVRPDDNGVVAAAGANQNARDLREIERGVLAGAVDRDAEGARVGEGRTDHVGASGSDDFEQTVGQRDCRKSAIVESLDPRTKPAGPLHGSLAWARDWRRSGRTNPVDEIAPHTIPKRGKPGHPIGNVTERFSQYRNRGEVVPR